MSTLFVVESPNKAKSIKKYFPDFNIVATVGHFRDLPVDRMGAEPPKHVPEYVTMDGKADIEKRLRAAANKASIIYLALDPDREGEAIAMHVANALGKKHHSKLKRVTYNEVTKTAINEAIKKAGAINWPMVRAQEARRIIDRYVGYIISPELTNIFRKHNPSMHFLSAGRVQSVALKLIVERCRAIDAFTRETHYGVEAKCEKENAVFTLVWKPTETDYQKGGKEILSEDDNTDIDMKTGGKDQESETQESLGNTPQKRIITQEALANAVVQRTQSLTLSSVKKTRKAVAPPKPLTTSRYVQLASKQMKLTTKHAMDIAQKLFEQGLITYHRTDSPVISEAATQEIRGFAKAKGLAIPDTARAYKAPAGSQEGHEALRVSTIFTTEAETGEDLSDRVYRMIWLITLQSQLSDAVDTVTSLIATNTHDHFIGRGVIEQSPGWRQAAQRMANGEQSMRGSSFAASGKAPATQGQQALPELSQGETLSVVGLDVVTKQTSPPPFFKESTIVQKLEAVGVGRPSTFAQVLERIVSQGYVDREKSLTYKATDLGDCIIAAIDERFAFIAIEYTAELEALFDRIANPKDGMDFLQVVEAVYVGLEHDAQQFKQAALASELAARITHLAPHVKKSKPKPKRKRAPAKKSTAAR